MIRRLLSRLRAIGQSIGHFVLDSQIARLAIMALRLWPRLTLLAVLVGLLCALCFVLAGLSARSVYLALSPASPSGIGAAIGAILAGVLVLELAAFAVTAALAALLQFAREVGRHRSAVLLSLATILAVATALALLRDDAALRADGLAVFGVTAPLLALTIWFERRYRNPARPGFRDFHVDVVEARRFIDRDAHGV
ncbi:MAG: hypothetical protein Q8S58_00365 [Bosea sp. (in: a-proteobacteria)]|uniref:hypothetical protein n=1 Tax=Bosea sp. (in: a-proteobacteria) TaxID=1871050 RepID=UPI0027367C93|nr:hypothetical protein [Bosea sp. (in: a-proteobacteria)]MDP3255463.1 hypothetical protein [Bosea sp. (in: a-proteobacteria)]MDP3317555.1 hypothetical protein [Bosea sp. (in: a-proteobacteria)]